MENEFVPYEEALALKDLGFDEPCFKWYDLIRHQSKDKPVYAFQNFNQEYTKIKSDVDCKAPLYQQAFRWFMDNHQLYFRPNYPYYDHEDYAGYIHKVGEYSSLAEIIDCKSPREAELMAIRKLIEIVQAL